jgi:hypothetical protein
MADIETCEVGVTGAALSYVVTMVTNINHSVTENVVRMITIAVIETNIRER